MLKHNVHRMMLLIGVIFEMKMYKSIKKYLISTLLLFCTWHSNSVAEIYGGGYWETIGIGNMPCEKFINKASGGAYKELGAVWLSGFMSGINFTSHDIYDITWGEDLYVLTELVISKCTDNPEKIISDIASEIVYSRYKDKNFTHVDDVNP